MSRLTYDRVVFTKTFHDWVAMTAAPQAPRSQYQTIAAPILTSLREELRSHTVVPDPPFKIDSRDGRKVVQLVGRPALYLIVILEKGRTGSELRVLGGWSSAATNGVSPFRRFDESNPVKKEREAVQSYLRRQIEASQYEMEIECLERVALALRQGQHLADTTAAA